MASAAALAIKFDLASRRMNAAMETLSARHGVPVPPPAVKASGPDERRTYEAERMADFMESLVNNQQTEKQDEQG